MDRLLRIIDGADVEEVFSGSDRKKLRNLGILNFHNKIWSLSDRAKRILLEQQNSI
jgi:hypothetical protein